MNTVDLNAVSSEQLEVLLREKRAVEARELAAQVAQYEALREDVIEKIIMAGKTISDCLRDFKRQAFGELQALYEVLKEHSKRQADGKGNFQVISADGQHRVCFKRQDRGYFDERSKQAEAHIIAFVNKRFEGDADARGVIMSLLERRKGQLDIHLVQKLYAMEHKFPDPEWQEGLKLLKESWQPNGTADYIMLYERDKNNKWQLIPLNFSSIDF